MAIVLDATIGGVSSNSYVTLARANVLAETLPHMNEWLTDATINRAQLLTHATRLIDRHFKPSGQRASTTQALFWPQSGLTNIATGVAIPENVIPEFVEYATVEWAWALHQEPDPYADVGLGIEALSSPSYRIEFTGNPVKRVVPQVVSDLLSPYVSRNVGSFVRVVRT